MPRRSCWRWTAANAAPGRRSVGRRLPRYWPRLRGTPAFPPRAHRNHARKICSRTYCAPAVCSAPTERVMPYRPDHRQRTRTRIIRSARLLFNRHGFDGASIDDIMRHAGLTRGGFYSYFQTKSDLYAEAVALALAEPPSRRWKGISVDFGAVDAARQVIRGYLSRQHFDDIDGSCPLVALPSDVSRSKPIVKRTYESVFKAMVDLFEDGLRRRGRPDRRRALAIAAMCVGGLAVARSIENPKLGDTLRDAGMTIALGLGGWPKSSSKRRRRKSDRR